MVAVLDTNVWISAIALSGKLSVIVDLLDTKRFVAAVSAPILDEFSRILREKFHRPDDLVEQYRSTVAAYAILVDPQESISVLNHDPDNRILECAVAARADVIVTGDKKHLLPLKAFRGIAIVSPAEFLDRHGY
jgi:putative PIN family toxin of toxin-antitoxin system